MRKYTYCLAGPCISVILLCLSCTKTVDDTSTALKVTGPIKVTADSYPFYAANRSVVPQDLGKYGYVEEEYFVSGKANVYDFDETGKFYMRANGL